MMDPYTALPWFDDEPKKPAARKLAEAVYRYNQKFPGWRAAHVEINAADAGLTMDGLTVTVSAHIRPNYFWVTGEEIS